LLRLEKTAPIYNSGYVYLPYFDSVDNIVDAILRRITCGQILSTDVLFLFDDPNIGGH